MLFRIIEWIRPNLFRILLGAVFTGLILYMGNLSTFWMLIVIMAIKMLLGNIGEIMPNVARDEEVDLILNNEERPAPQLTGAPRYLLYVLENVVAFPLSLLPSWDTEAYIKMMYHTIFKDYLRVLHKQEEPKSEPDIEADLAAKNEATIEAGNELNEEIVEDNKDDASINDDHDSDHKREEILDNLKNE